LDRSFGLWDFQALLNRVSITQPMPMALEFDAAIDSDEIKGSVTLGDFGTSSFSGSCSG
jgi:hypothetical protein